MDRNLWKHIWEKVVHVFLAKNSCSSSNVHYKIEKDEGIQNVFLRKSISNQNQTKRIYFDL